MFYTQVLGGNRFLFLTSNACRHPLHSYKNNPTLLYLRWQSILQTTKHSYCESMKYVLACQPEHCNEIDWVLFS